MMPAIAQTSPASGTTTQKLRWMPGMARVADVEEVDVQLVANRPEPNQPSVYAPRAKNAT